MATHLQRLHLSMVIIIPIYFKALKIKLFARFWIISIKATLII